MATAIAALAVTRGEPDYKVRRRVRSGELPARKIANAWLVGQDAGDYCSLYEAATQLGLSASRLYQLVAAGRLAAEKAGRNWRLARADVAAFATLPRLPGGAGHRR